ncbi:MAG: type II toxin-antitoxin system RelE/ParE family toxin [Verrucomicrobia bacterium]|nr:type II toxin-antitoxin system RelE/ParE family toxin [Verrucomicrobiota bacterium]
MIHIQISQEALDDLNEDFLFYESQETDLGAYFSSCLQGDIEGLKISAGTDRIVYRDYHRLLSQLFLFGIFYTLEGAQATVWAVVDLCRNPSWIRDHLQL